MWGFHHIDVNIFHRQKSSIVCTCHGRCMMICWWDRHIFVPVELCKTVLIYTFIILERLASMVAWIAIYDLVTHAHEYHVNGAQYIQYIYFLQDIERATYHYSRDHVTIVWSLWRRHQSIVISSAECKPSNWDTGSMCEDYFYRNLWIRYVV